MVEWPLEVFGDHFNRKVMVPWGLRVSVAGRSMHAVTYGYLWTPVSGTAENRSEPVALAPVCPAWYTPQLWPLTRSDDAEQSPRL